MAIILVIAIYTGVIWFIGRDYGKKHRTFFTNSYIREEQAAYRNLVLDHVKDTGPRQYVEPVCNVCGSPVKCGIKIVDISKGKGQVFRVDVDPTEMDMHKEFVHASELRS